MKKLLGVGMGVGEKSRFEPPVFIEEGNPLFLGVDELECTSKSLVAGFVGVNAEDPGDEARGVKGSELDLAEPMALECACGGGAFTAFSGKPSPIISARGERESVVK